MKSRKNNIPFKKKPTPLDIIKEQRQRFSKAQKKKAKDTDSDERRARKLNKELDYAGSLLKAGSEQIALKLYPLLLQLSGQTDINPGDKNKYFTVDKTWDKNDPYSLFKHVKFNEIPDKVNVMKQLQQLESDPHMSEEQYEDYSEQWHKQAGRTLAGRLGLQNYEVLEQIMNSTPAWQIAKRGAMDSEQVLERWLELYDTMNEAQQTDTGIFDWAIQQIENGKRSINWLINTIDDEIRLMLAGKYSHRRKVRN